MNVINISGTVGKSELINVNGTALLKFSVAVKKYSKDDKDAVEWFNCSVWANRATALQNYLVKGAGVAVTGEMQINYNPEKKQSFPQIHVNDVDIIRWPNTDNQSNQQSSPQSSATEGFQAIDDSSDLPF